MRVSTHRYGWMLALCLVLVSSCATAPIRNTALASEQLSAAALRLQQRIMQLHTAQLINDEDYLAWQRGFLETGEALQALNAALRASDGKGALEQVNNLLSLFDDLTASNVISIGKDDRIAVLVAVESCRAVLVTLSLALDQPKAVQ